MLQDNGTLEAPVHPSVYWKVLGSGQKHGYWRCRCTCGIEKDIRADALRKGSSKSCGCQKARLVGDSRRTHGMSRTPMHNVWWGMIQRCEDPSVESYATYGAEGVKVCDRWRGPTGFISFLADMGERPSDKHQIDRKEGTGHYEPGNCRWATPKQNSRNRKSNINVTFGGVTKCLADWAADLGVAPTSLKYRIKKWGVDRALTAPVDTRKGRKRGKRLRDA